MINILITGGHGFLGKHVTALFDEQNIKYLAPKKSELNLLNLDHLDDYIKEHSVEYIIHLAGDVGGIGYNQNKQFTLGFRNLQIGMNVLRVSASNLLGVVMVGTCCSYPAVPKTIPFIEEELFDGMPEITNSGYGIAKRTLIKLGTELREEAGINVVNLIPTNMIGEFDHFEDGRSHVVPALIKKFEFAKENNTDVSIWGDGSASREFLYAGDCADAILRALYSVMNDSYIDTSINIGTGHEITIKNLVGKIAKIGEYTSTITFDNSKPNGQLRRCLNIDKQYDLLGFKPQTHINDAIKRCIDWYRANEQ